MPCSPKRRADFWPLIRMGLPTQPHTHPCPVPFLGQPSYPDPELQPSGRPGLQGMQRPSGPRISSMVSSLTRTSRMGYTKDRMRLLKPQAPTYEGQALSLGSPTTGRKPDSLGG